MTQATTPEHMTPKILFGLSLVLTHRNPLSPLPTTSPFLPLLPGLLPTLGARAWEHSRPCKSFNLTAVWYAPSLTTGSILNCDILCCYLFHYLCFVEFFADGDNDVVSWNGARSLLIMVNNVAPTQSLGSSWSWSRILSSWTCLDTWLKFRSLGRRRRICSTLLITNISLTHLLIKITNVMKHMICLNCSAAVPCFLIHSSCISVTDPLLMSLNAHRNLG